MSNLKRFSSLISMTCALSAVPFVAFADTKQEHQCVCSPAQTSKAFTAVAKKSIPAVVFIKVQSSSADQEESNYQNPYDFNGEDFFNRFFGTPGRGGQPQRPQPQLSQGSGFLVTSDGYIMTNAHVVKGADKITAVLNDGRELEATLIGADSHTDIAVIKVEGKDFPFLSLGNSDEIDIGEWVIAIGSPFQLEASVTVGVVSAKGRQNLKITDFEDFIQTDAAVNPGNSGGALVNTKGELIGINTAIASTTGSYAGYSFAVPVNIARKVVDDILEFGTVQRAFIGVSISDLNGKVASERGLNISEGAYVNGLSKGGAAYAAGIREGDIIVAVDATEVKNVTELQEKIGSYRPGDLAQVTVLRDEKLRKFDVELRNKNGDTEMVSKDTEVLTQLGADLKALSPEQMQKLGLRSGLQVQNLSNGKLKGAGIKEGFIITRVDRQAVQSSKDVMSALNKKDGGVLIEGVYPNGLTAYYGFGM